MSKNHLSIITAAILACLAVPVQAQVLSCGPGLGYVTESGDHVVLIGASCMRTNTLGPVSAGANVAYGFGNYDVDPDFQDIVDGSYSAYEVNVEVTYPISVSESSPIFVYPMATAGVLHWSEDCDFSDCSGTDWPIDLGGGVSFNIISVEAFYVANASYNFGGRVKALFDLN